MDCDRSRQAIENLIDGRVEPLEEQALRVHAEGCAECAASLAKADAFVGVMTESLKSTRPDGAVMDEVLEALQEEPLPVAPASFAERQGWKLAAAAALMLSAGLLYMLSRTYGTALPRGERGATLKHQARVVAPPAARTVGKAVRGALEARADLRSEFRVVARGTALTSGTTLRVTGDAPAEIALADRVKVLLDAGSEVRLAPDPARPFDLCLVRGRVFADVVSGTPFTVFTGFGSVRSLGTRFGVALSRDPRAGEGMGVNVRKGVVRVLAAGTAEKLAAGGCLFVGRTARLRCRNGEVCGTSLAWTSGKRSGSAAPTGVGGQPTGALARAPGAEPTGEKKQKGPGEKTTPRQVRAGRGPGDGIGVKERGNEGKTASGVGSGGAGGNAGAGGGTGRPAARPAEGLGRRGQPGRSGQPGPKLGPAGGDAGGEGKRELGRPGEQRGEPGEPGGLVRREEEQRQVRSLSRRRGGRRSRSNKSRSAGRSSSRRGSGSGGKAGGGSRKAGGSRNRSGKGGGKG